MTILLIHCTSTHKMTEDFANTRAVAIAADGVHITVQTEHYEGYIATWVDNRTYTLKRGVLTVRAPAVAEGEVADMMRAPALAGRFVGVLQQYQIEKKVSAITTDGPRVMSTYRGEKNAHALTGRHTRAHTITHNDTFSLSVIVAMVEHVRADPAVAFTPEQRAVYDHYFNQLGRQCGFILSNDDSNLLLAHQICVAHVLQKIVEAGWSVPAIETGAESGAVRLLLILTPSTQLSRSATMCRRERSGRRSCASTSGLRKKRRAAPTLQCCSAALKFVGGRT
jgi:hypothetical protein